MLKVFRDNLKYLSWILWAVIALFVLFVFVDFGGGLKQSNATGGNNAAKVGGRTVTMADFEQQYRQLEQMYGQLYGGQMTPELAKQLQLPMQALNRAVNEQVLLDEAERLGLRVSDAELRAKILEQPVFVDDKGRFIGEDKYAQLLSANKYTVASFETEMRNQILREKLNDVLRNGIFIPDDEVEKAYREQVEKAKIRYIQLPRAQTPGPEPTPAEVSAFFEAHKQEYKLPEQREGAYLLVEPERLRDQVKLGDAELQEYYNGHKNEFARPEQVHARHILIKTGEGQKTDAAAQQAIEQIKKRIAGGADFATVARETSDDTGTKQNGGDLGAFGRGQMVKEFEDAAFGAQVGQLVGPVKTPFGFHLLQVTEKLPGGEVPFEQAKEQIRTRLSFTRAGELAETKAKALAAQLAKDKPKSAADLAALAAKNPGVTSAETGKFGAQDPIPGLSRVPPLNAAAFSIKKGEVTDAVQAPRGWAVLWLKEIYEPKVPQLSDVEPRVRQGLQAQKQQEATLQRLKEARTSGKTLDEIAAELGLTVKESPEFGAQGGIPGLGLVPELARTALAMENGQIGGPMADAQGAVLFEVKDRKNWDPIQFNTARAATRETLQQERLGQLLSALVERRRRELGVEFDRRLLDSFGISPEAVDRSQQQG
jgi:peptidyl-prolyl cis-trans isomerase D